MLKDYAFDDNGYKSDELQHDGVVMLKGSQVFLDLLFVMLISIFANSILSMMMFIENKISRTNINAIDYNVAMLMQLILIKNNATIVRCTEYFLEPIIRNFP